MCLRFMKMMTELSVLTTRFLCGPLYKKVKQQSFCKKQILCYQPGCFLSCQIHPQMFLEIFNNNSNNNTHRATVR